MNFYLQLIQLDNSVARISQWGGGGINLKSHVNVLNFLYYLYSAMKYENKSRVYYKVTLCQRITVKILIKNTINKGGHAPRVFLPPDMLPILVMTGFYDQSIFIAIPIYKAREPI